MWTISTLRKCRSRKSSKRFSRGPMATENPLFESKSAFHKYWVILSTRTQEDMAYRANYIFGAIFRFLPLVTTIFLWWAIYAGRKATGASPLIGGMTYEDMVVYNALMHVAR